MGAMYDGPKASYVRFICFLACVKQNITPGQPTAISFREIHLRPLDFPNIAIIFHEHDHTTYRDDVDDNTTHEPATTRSHK